MGRNAGSTVNLVIKSGTNNFHGSGFYFNRHESAGRQLAGCRSRHAEAADSQQPGRLLARRPDRPEQDVLLLDPRRSRSSPPANSVATTVPSHGVGGERDAAAESVRRAGQSGVDEPARALAGGQPDRAGGGAELRSAPIRIPTTATTASRRSITRSIEVYSISGAVLRRRWRPGRRRPVRRTAPISSRCRAGCTTSRSCRPRCSRRTW